MRRVVITGVGPVTSLGLGADTVWPALLAGSSGIGPISSFDASALETQIAGEVPGFIAKDWIAKRKSIKMMTRAVQYGMAAVRLAIEDSKIDVGSIKPERVGIAIGTGSGGGELDAVVPALEASAQSGSFDIVHYGAEGINEINPLWLIRGLSNAVLGHASTEWVLKGWNTNICNSGASGLQAIGDAARAIGRSRVDVMIAGGYDAVVNPQGMIRFERLGMLSTTACRPFDAKRDGFLPADGAAFMTLETLESAQARGAKIYAEVVGYGSASDGEAFLDPVADGAGITRAMRAALDDADIEPADVDVVFAHAPGSKSYDQAENVAIRTALGDAAKTVAVPALKSMIGHCIAASGAVASAAAALSISTGQIPPTINREHPDPACDLDYVTEGAREANVRHAVINASGLGGMHATLVLRRVDKESK